MDLLEYCKEECGKEVTVKDICNSVECNMCDLPYIYLEQLPYKNMELEKELNDLRLENKILKECVRDGSK